MIIHAVYRLYCPRYDGPLTNSFNALTVAILFKLCSFRLFISYRAERIWMLLRSTGRRSTRTCLTSTLKRATLNAGGILMLSPNKDKDVTITHLFLLCSENTDHLVQTHYFDFMKHLLRRAVNIIATQMRNILHLICLFVWNCIMFITFVWINQF